jgi:hypothetical protein
MNKSFAVQTSLCAQSAHRSGTAVAIWRACRRAGIVEGVF